MRGFVKGLARTFTTRRALGTLGIIGTNSGLVGEFTKQLINHGNSIGLKKDQHFPEILSVGIPCRDDSRYLKNNAELCLDFGCDGIAMPEKDPDLNFTKRVQEDLGIPLLSLKGDDDMEALAKKALDFSLAVRNPRRPSLIDDPKTKTEDVGIDIRLKKDERDRERRIRDRMRHGGYPSLEACEESGGFVGVLGGAGPLASAQLCASLAVKEVPFVHYSASSAPPKNDFEIGIGPSYLGHYINAVRFFERLGMEALLIPCNTVHGCLLEFCGDSLLKVVDIRAAVLSEYHSSEGFILLGTDATVGINTASPGVYEQFRQEHYPYDRPFVIASPRQQKKIMRAIYDIKAGRFDVAKEKINEVIKQLRETHGNLPVILACTELPMVFTSLELMQRKLVDPMGPMVRETQRRLLEVVRSNQASFPFRDHSERSRVEIEEISDTDSENEKTKIADIDGFKVSIFKNRNEYQIKILGRETKPSRVVARRELIEKFLEEFSPPSEEGEKQNPNNILRSDSTISFKNPSPELDKEIQEWALQHNLEIISGRSSTNQRT